MKNTKRLSIFIAFALALALPFSLPAQDSARLLTLQDAINLSLGNNKLLRIDKARIDGAHARVDQAQERKMPDLSASGSYYLINQPNFEMKTGGSGSGGSQPSADNSGFKVNQAVIGSINASLPIYTGGQIKYGIQSATYLAEATRLDADIDREAVIANTVAAYANLYKAAETVKVVAQNLEEENQRVKDFTNLEKNGLLARNDLLKASLQASNVELALLEVKNNLRIANININLMLGLPESTILMVDTKPFALYKDERGMAAWETLALENRKEFEANTKRKDATNAQMMAVKGSMLPSVALSGGYFNAYAENLLTITNAINVGVGVKYNVSSLWKTQSKMREVEATQNELNATRELLDEKIRLQVSKAYEDYILSLKKTEVYESAITQALENYRITNNKYNNGLATLTDLLDADLARLKAQLNKANSAADVTVAYANLQQSAGVLINTLQQKK
jgi:outer membrane protein